MKDIDSRFVELENIVYDNNFVREFVEDLHIDVNKLQAENKKPNNIQEIINDINTLMIEDIKALMESE